MKPTQKAKRAFFCIVQIAPSSNSATIRNIGLLLVCTECRFIQGMFVNGYRRLLSALAPDPLDTQEMRPPDCITSNRGASRKSFRSLAELKDFLCTIPDGIKLAESWSAEVVNPYSELSSLYDRYVIHQNRPSACLRQSWPEGNTERSVEFSADFNHMMTAGYSG